MRKSLIVPIALSALALGACSKQAATTDAPAQANADKAAAEMAFRFSPGQYRTTIEVTDFAMPGMPPQAETQMKAMFAKAASQEYCLKPEDAAKGIEAMKENMAKGDCKFDKFEASGGTVSSAFTCKSDGMEMHSTSQGTYSDTGSQVAIKADMKAPDGKTMHIEQTVKTERIGDCK